MKDNTILTKKEREEFMDTFKLPLEGTGIIAQYDENDRCTGTLPVDEAILEFFESLLAKRLAKQYLVAFHEGYQTRWDEDEYEPKKRTEKAFKAMERRAKVYREIIDKNIEVNHKLNI